MSIQTFTAASHRPADLSRDEVTAYVRAYARAAQTWSKKNGSHGLEGRPPVDPEERARFVANLHSRARQVEEERHPTCHRAGMSAVKKWRTKYTPDRLAAPKVTRRRHLAACPNCGHDLTAA